MNRFLRLFSVFILAVFGIAGYPGSSQGTTPPAGETPKKDPAIVQEINAGYIENITFDKLPGRERVIISLSRRVLISLPSMPLVAVEDRSSSVLLMMEDMYVPDHLRRPLGENVLGNIIRVVPQQVSHEGKQWVHLLVELKEKAPYSVRRDGGNVLLDFHVAALADKASPAPARARVDGKSAQPAITDPQRPQADERLAKEPARREGVAAAPLISLDFQEANIKGVLRLLSEMAGINIVSGEDVKGAITVHLRNVSWEQALEVILDVSALAKRQTGNVITVMTMERMKKEETERASLREAQRRGERDRKKAELEKETERLEMEVRVQAEKERPAVKPGEPGTDVFVDTDIRRVLQLLAEESRKRGDMISIVVGDDVKGALTADFKEVPWEHKLDTILEIKSLAKRRVGNVITVMTAERMKKEESERAVAEQARRKTEQEHREKEQKILAEQMKIDQAKRKEEETLARPPLLTRVISISYADPKALKENLQELLLKDVKEGVPPGSVRVDEHSNSLIIQASKDDLVKLVSLIEKVDKPTPQVLIRGNIVETTKSTARTLGVQWGGALQSRLDSGDIYVTAGGAGTVPPGNIMSGGYLPPGGGRGLSGHGFLSNFAGMDILKAGQSFGSLGLLMGSIGGSILELQLHALQKDGKLKILSSPHITTLDNQMAFTENGEKVPYVALDENGRAVVKYEDAVLRLEITPNTIDDQSMKMKIVVKKDEVDSSRTVDKNPFIVKKHTVTNLIVRDGETIVIAGLTKQRKAEDNSGIPWFKNIPGLGWLFKAEAKDDLMEETMIFITPTIIRPPVAIGIQEGP